MRPRISNQLCLNVLVSEDEAPSGMLARGKYDAISRFVDDDDHEHLLFEWTFEIKKDWQ